VTVLDRLAATDPRAWTAATIDDPAKWYCRLPAACLLSVEDVLADLRRNPRPVPELRLPPAHTEAWREGVRPALQALEEGRGFVVIDGFERDRYTREEMTAIYWLVGLALGEPFAQNVQGTILYDVKDTGQSVYQGARFSVTNAESTYHTDNSFGEIILDYVALLCLASARSGGLSQLVSGYSIYEELRKNYSAQLEILMQPFEVDRRGGVREGERPTVRYPVIAETSDGLLYRYLRFWIHEGHAKSGTPLTAAQLEALDTLDAVAARPELRVEFMLQPGQMLFANNRWTLHNRTAFDDWEEAERKRHYVRLWLYRRGN
jgi:alpha-ketoglutarate-dependent taurine dioxygenase